MIHNVVLKIDLTLLEEYHTESFHQSYVAITFMNLKTLYSTAIRISDEYFWFRSREHLALASEIK